MAHRQLLAFALLLLLGAGVTGVHGSERAGKEAAGNATSRAEELFQEAVAIRDKLEPSARELRQAVKLLRESAGITYLGLARDGSSASAAAAAARIGSNDSDGGGAGGRVLTSAGVELVLRNDTAAFRPALKELIYIYRTGDGVTPNHAVAHRLLEKLAELGDGDSQTDLGYTLAMGISPLGPNSRGQLFRFVAPDLPAAMVYYFFGARAGDHVANMILGYRHLQGLGVPKSCQASVLHYLPVAEWVIGMAQEREGLPQVRVPRLSHKTAHARQRSAEQEVLHYQWFADFGSVDAARAVAHMLTHGSIRDFEQAIYYLKQAAGAGDADAMAHLGHIYANGIAVPQDNDTALAWFWKAAEKGHPSGMFGLGYMYFAGHGRQRNYAKALKYLRQAAESSSGAWAGQGDALFYLGLMHLKGLATKADSSKAAQLFELASKHGNLLASYNLAVLHLAGATREADPCQAAALLLKKVAERGFPILQEAHEDFQHGDYDWALLGYLKAAEMGMEIGQSNAAWMLAEGYGYEGPGAGPVAMMLYKRASEQGNTEALLRIGDGYWYGKGVAADWSRAAKMYSEASKYKNGQALFNLGYMHEYGVGLPQDFHLAKRFYDRALEAQPEGKLAVQIALLSLRLHGLWLTLEPKLPRSLALLGAGLFAPPVGPPEGAAVAHHSPQHRTAWDRVREALTLNVLFDKLDALLDVEDGLDTTVIGLLAMLFLLVVWRRQTLRARQARFFPQAPAAAAPVLPPAFPPPPAGGPLAAQPAEARAGAAGLAPEGGQEVQGQGQQGGLREAGAARAAGGGEEEEEEGSGQGQQAQHGQQHGAAGEGSSGGPAGPAQDGGQSQQGEQQGEGWERPAGDAQ